MSRNLGELAIELAIAVHSENFFRLKSVLAQAWEEDYEIDDAREAMKRALAPLSREQQRWFEEMIGTIQSSSQPAWIGEWDEIRSRCRFPPQIKKLPPELPPGLVIDEMKAKAKAGLPQVQQEATYEL